MWFESITAARRAYRAGKIDKFQFDAVVLKKVAELTGHEAPAVDQGGRFSAKQRNEPLSTATGHLPTAGATHNH